MGLDSVEMIIAVEDRFGVYIPDAQAVHIFTVGDLYNTVLRLRTSAATLKCKTQHVFYRFRASLPFHLRVRCHPDRPLHDFIPERGRRRYYNRLSEDAGVQFPRLLARAWLPDIFLAITGGGFFSGLLLYLLTFKLIAFSVMVLTVPLLMGYLALRAIYSTILPNATVREFIKSTTELNYVDILPDFENDAEVLHVLKGLIVERLGVDDSEVVMSARFQQDLGVD